MSYGNVLCWFSEMQYIAKITCEHGYDLIQKVHEQVTKKNKTESMATRG